VARAKAFQRVDVRLLEAPALGNRLMAVILEINVNVQNLQCKALEYSDYDGVPPTPRLEFDFTQCDRVSTLSPLNITQDEAMALIRSYNNTNNFYEFDMTIALEQLKNRMPIQDQYNATSKDNESITKKKREERKIRRRVIESGRRKEIIYEIRKWVGRFVSMEFQESTYRRFFRYYGKVIGVFLPGDSDSVSYIVEFRYRDDLNVDKCAIFQCVSRHDMQQKARIEPATSSGRQNIDDFGTRTKPVWHWTQNVYSRRPTSRHPCVARVFSNPTFYAKVYKVDQRRDNFVFW
jgi:hypothetical protein